MSLNVHFNRSFSTLSDASSVELSRYMTINRAMFWWAFRKSRRVVSSSAHSKVHWCFSISTGVGIPNSKPVSSIKSSSITHAPYTVCVYSICVSVHVQSVCDGWPTPHSVGRVGILEIASSFCAAEWSWLYTSLVTVPVSWPICLQKIQRRNVRLNSNPPPPTGRRTH